MNFLQLCFYFMLLNCIYTTHIIHICLLYKNVYKNPSNSISKKGRGRYCVWFLVLFCLNTSQIQISRRQQIESHGFIFQKACVHISSSFKHTFARTVGHGADCAVTGMRPGAEQGLCSAAPNLQSQLLTGTVEPKRDFHPPSRPRHSTHTLCGLPTDSCNDVILKRIMTRNCTFPNLLFNLKNIVLGNLTSYLEK